MTLRLNPDDLAAWQQAVQNQQAGDPDNICCIGDWSVGHAECIVETDQGVVEYLIQEQLKQVTAALLGSGTPVESSR
jgi:flagellar biosynthesis/type III secretory pathway protein FliH